MSPARALTVDLVAFAAGAVLLMFAGLPGWILLAAAGGVVATRSWARVVVSITAFVLAAALLAWSIGDGSGLGVAGGVLGAAAAVWAAFAGRTWPALGSRYQRDGVRPGHQLSDWDALDAGIDPTDGPTHPSSG